MSFVERFKNIFVGFTSLVLGKVEHANPEVLLEAEKERFHKHAASFKEALQSQAGVSEKLSEQVRHQTKERDKLESRIMALMESNQSELAAPLAVQLQQIEDDLKENESQLEVADKAYKDLLKTRDVTMAEVRDRLAELGRKIKSTKEKEALAKMMDQAAELTNKNAALPGGNIDRLNAALDERATKAAGAIRVARDSVDMTSVNQKEAEQKALAKGALARFAAKRGLTIQGAPASSESAPAPVQEAAPAPSRQIGPQASAG